MSSTSFNASPTMTTSNSGKFKDPAPHIRAAGKLLTDPNDNVAACIKFDTKNRPITPPQMKPYRRSYQREPGHMMQHFSKAFDPPPPDIRFGQANIRRDTAAMLIQPPVETAFAERRRMLRESLFKTTCDGAKRAALRPNLLPKIDPNFCYGVATNLSESAKNLMYPVGDPYDNTDVIHQRYIHTHGEYDAGEQKNRGYNWAAHGIDPTNFRFGSIDKHNEVDGAMKALKPDEMKSYKTAIVKKIVEDHRDISYDTLGQPKNLGFGSRTLPSEYVFGKPTKPDEWGAMRCMQGDYSLVDSRPDEDVGRTRAPAVGKHSLNIDHVPDKVFGIPTIRVDIPRPKTKKVTDFKNYGDESKADGVMYPSRFCDFNVHEEDFLRPVDRSQMKKLLTNSNIILDDETFDRVWSFAETMSNDNFVCVESFHKAMDNLNL